MMMIIIIIIHSFFGYNSIYHDYQIIIIWNQYDPIDLSKILALVPGEVAQAYDLPAGAVHICSCGKANAINHPQQSLLLFMK